MSDATAYFYENTGVGNPPHAQPAALGRIVGMAAPLNVACAYLYQNTGFELTPSPDAAAYIYENVEAP